MRDDLQDSRITLDALDVRLIRAGRQHPRAGMLELSRLIGVSRATVQARLERMEAAGVIIGYGPEVDLVAAGYPVLAFVTLEIAQGGLAGLATALTAVPQVLEAYGTTGTGDVHIRIAATSNRDLQQILIDINRIPEVVRSTSVIALSEVVPMRTLPLLEAQDRRHPSRVPALRDPMAGDADSAGDPRG